LAQTTRLWTQEQGKTARAVLDTALQELAALIAYDLTAQAPPDRQPYKAPEGAEKHLGGTVEPIARGPMLGYVEHKTPGRVWVRLPLGELCGVAQ
jgi:hypothetical protein